MAENVSGLDELIRRNDWRVEMAAYDQDATRRLVEAYQQNMRDIEANMQRMIEDMKNRQGDEGFTVEEFRSLDTYQELLAGVKSEMDDFGVILRNQSLQGIDTGISAGLNGAERTVGLFLPESPSSMGIWVRPDPQAVRNIIDFVDKPAWETAFSRFGDNAVNSLSDLLITGVAQGRNPNQIAKIISEWTSVPLSWATNISRTSQIYSARLATHAGYASNPDVVEGWMWLSATDQRTCISCWSKHGMIFDLDKTLNDHHQGRCTPVPMVSGRQWWLHYPTGEEKFEGLSQAEQQSIMGPSLYEAWSKNEVSFEDFSRTYQNDIYGEMIVAQSLAGMRR